MPTAVPTVSSSIVAVPRRAVAVLLAGLLLVAVLLGTYWPAGVVAGTVLGALAVFAIGRRMTESAAAAPVDEELVRRLGIGVDEDREADVRSDLVRLKEQLGDAYPDFARAARLVVSTQYASAARLQRELHVPYSRARRLLDGLESERLVGPATGTLPRQVLMPAERLPELERLLADA